MKSFVTISLVAAALVGCSGKTAEEPFDEPETQSATLIAAPRPEGHVEPDPKFAHLFGEWIYSHQTCYEDTEATPDPDPKNLWLQLLPDGSYSFSLEGFPYAGTFKVEDFQSTDPRIVLDNNIHFVPEGETLENWGEGEATYVCANVFVRGSR